MKLGIFGGSFDPIHNGHLLLAQCCLKQAGLDEIWFTPTVLQPLKPTGPQASNSARCEMVELAIASQPAFRLCKIEIDRGGTSYSVDTLQAIQKANLQAELFFLMGADSLREFPQWHQPAEILRLATLLVVRRADEPDPNYAVIETIVEELLPSESQTAPRWIEIEMPATPISSTEIRSRVEEGKAIEEFVPRKVAAYIREQGIYNDKRQQ